MLLAGDVEKITLYNDKVVEFGLTPAALRKPEYLTDLTARRGPFAVGRDVQFAFPIVDPKLFKEDLDKVQANIDPAKRQGSAGGPGGQIFNIGKSRAALFEGGDKVKVTFKDVAGLEEA
nr:hypothetical protein [Tanacetum cinerariifolium]